MGLDWNPLWRARPGNKRKVAQLFAEIMQTPEDERAPQWELFKTLTESPNAVLGAPRIGFDAAANEWVAANLREEGRLGELEKTLGEMRGQEVLDLVPECDGFPPYSNLFFGRRYTFRAEGLIELSDILDDDLLDAAYSHMLAPELAEYAAALHEAAAAYAAEHGVPLDSNREKAAESAEAAGNVDILLWAARWARFWSDRGYGLSPWF